VCCKAEGVLAGEKCARKKAGGIGAIDKRVVRVKREVLSGLKG